MSLFHSDQSVTKLGYKFKTLESVCAPGSPDRCNEDAFAVNAAGTAAIAIDGVTSKSEKSWLELPDVTDPAWMARRLAEIFRDQSRYHAESHMDMLRNLAEQIRSDFHTALGERERPSHVADYPMAVLGMARILGNDVELLNVGDAEIGILLKDGQVLWLHKDPVHRRIEAEREPVKEQLRAQGITDRNELHRHLRPLMREQHDMHMNTAGGFGVLSPARDLMPEHVRRVVMPARMIDMILLQTDGLGAYFDTYKLQPHGNLDFVLTRNGNPVTTMLRQVEERENSCDDPNPSSLKRSDDKTGVLLKVRPATVSSP